MSDKPIERFEVVRIADFLIPERVNLDLHSSERDEAVRELAGLLVPSQSVDVFVKSVLDREIVQSTAVGYGIAFPHGRCDSCSSILIAVGRHASGVDFNPLDDEPVRLIFLFSTPIGLGADYLRIIGALARLVRLPSVRADLLSAVDPAAFLLALR